MTAASLSAAAPAAAAASPVRSAALSWRGVVEGFYGEPWTTDERLAFFEFAEEVGLTSYVYAPKFDPYHRDRWREPYPEAELLHLAELNRRAAGHGVAFVYAISPALSMRFSSDDDHRALDAKCEQLWDAGIRSFSLLFDDVPTELPDESDRARFGDDPAGAGRAHGHAARRFRDGFLARHGITEPVLVCPTDYAGTAGSPYRDGLAEELPAEARILWTGPDIVVGAITRDDIDRAAESYGRDLALWDNFPVNDFDRSRLFLGPLTGRTGDTVGSRLTGIVANPMVEAAPSRFALATVADWAGDPAAYDPDAAAARAFELVAGGAPGLRALVEACSSWPPSAPPSAALDALLPDALGGDRPAVDAVAERMRALASTDASGASADLAAALEPWVQSARSAGAAGELACRVLAGEHGLEDALVAARDAAQGHYANVLRTPVATLVDAAFAVLHPEQDAGARAGGPEGGAGAAGAGQLLSRILLLTGPNPAPGDRELAEFLGANGFDVVIRSTVEPDELAAAALSIVTRAADESEAVTASRSAVPLIAWGHIVALGLATESATPLSLDAVEIVEPAHPLAAGLSGRVPVYQGPSKLTWGEPGPDAVVIAREPESAHPVLAVYDRGTTLADGTEAPAKRISLFLGSDGFAPWLVTDAARALVLAAVRKAAMRASPTFAAKTAKGARSTTTSG
jgi:hypothetical protein